MNSQTPRKDLVRSNEIEPLVREIVDRINAPNQGPGAEQETGMQQETAVLTVQRTSRSLNCGCVYHEESVSGSSAFLRGFIGFLFVGYKTSPRLTQQCEDPDCQGRSMFVFLHIPTLASDLLWRDLSRCRDRGHAEKKS